MLETYYKNKIKYKEFIVMIKFGNFYEMFDKGINSIGHDNHYYGSVSGNYDGTDLEITVVK